MTAQSTRSSNRLAAEETSAYLRQHMHNPVDWRPWGEEAFRSAPGANSTSPVLVSIGYSACHWCHVMEHESFEDPGDAALMNAHLIREHQGRSRGAPRRGPDLHGHRRAPARATGGWPLTVFCTPTATALLRRHLLSRRAAPRHAGLPRGADQASSTAFRRRREPRSSETGHAHPRGPRRTGRRRPTSPRPGATVHGRPQG